MENIIGLLIFLALLLFEALQRSKKNKRKQQPPMPGEPYPDEHHYELPPADEPVNDLERALREIQDALTSASEPKPAPPPELPEYKEPLALPPRPLPARTPEMQPEVFTPHRETYHSEESFERLPALPDESVVARPSVAAHVASHGFPAVAQPPKPESKRSHSLLADLDLRDPDQLRRAVLLHEILGPPKSRR
ncbi:MAG: hypothetical protein RhofKO_38330 [Rhodothermales bacterium]